MLIFDIQYFGNLYYYKLLFNRSYIIFDQYEPHQKKSFNNRCTIAGANGPILLSIPLQKGRIQTTPLKDIRISNDENWQKRHWRSILSSYNASPWFSFYRDSMADVFSRPHTFLMDWNLSCLDWTIRQMRMTLHYELNGQDNRPDLSGVAKQPVRPKTEGVNLNIRYQQVFESRHGFIPGLSILDLLFCTGPKTSVALLKSGDLNQLEE